MAAPAGKRGERGVRAAVLAVLLFLAWVLLSGHFEPFLIVAGAASATAVAALSWRMGVVDREGLALELLRRAPRYHAWLVWQIVRSNIDVIRRVLDPRLPITPCVVALEASAGDDLGVVVYSNSITLTPGTVTMEVEKNRLRVHALSAEGAADLKAGEMDRRVCGLTGAPARAQ